MAQDSNSGSICACSQPQTWYTVISILGVAAMHAQSVDSEPPLATAGARGKGNLTSLQCQTNRAQSRHGILVVQLEMQGGMCS